MVERPERKHVVGIKISADSWEDVLAALRGIEFDLAKDGPGRSINSGGVSFSYTVFDKETLGMTHEYYFQVLDEWLEEQRAAYKAESLEEFNG